MCTKHGTVLLAACAMLATSSLSISAAHAQGFGYIPSPALLRAAASRALFTGQTFMTRPNPITMRARVIIARFRGAESTRHR